MSRPCFRRIAVLALVLALVAPWATAEPRVRDEARTAVELHAADLRLRELALESEPSKQ